MAFEIPNFQVGVLPSNSNLDGVGSDTNGQFKCVTLVANTQVSGQAAVDLASTGTIPFGILQNKPQQYEAATVMVGGVSKAVLGGSVTMGQLLMPSTASLGALIVATSGNYIAAQALETGVSGDTISVLLKPSATKA